MDPTTALADLREKVHALDTMSPSDRDDVEEIVTTFDGLDEWLQRGGFLPDQWIKAAGSSGRRADRHKIEGVTHGTRREYNAGCGCNPCTMANRLRRNLTDEELLEMA